MKQPKAPKVWFVYVLLCENDSLYTGISPDPERRLKAHREGRGAAYTRMHKPLEMLSKERIGSYPMALRRERQVKGLSRPAKLRYVENPRRLARPGPSARVWPGRPRRRRGRARSGKETA